MESEQTENNAPVPEETVETPVENEQLFDLKQMFLILGLIGAVIIVILFLFGTVFSPGEPEDTVVAPVKVENLSGTATDKEELIKNEKFLAGTVESVAGAEGVNGGTITVRSAVLDVSGEERFIEASERVFVEKEFSLRFDGRTEFDNKPAAELAAGDVVQIDTNESIYLSNDLVATKVHFFDPQAEAKKQIIGDTHQLYGSVVSAADEQVVVSVKLVDLEALDTMDLTGSYAVPRVDKEVTVTVAPETVIFDEEGETVDSIAVGDTVRIVTEQDVYLDGALSAEQVLIFAEVEEID